MARKHSSTLAEECDQELLDHIHGLGLKNVEEYRDWCDRNGFSRKLAKHWKLRSRERYFAYQQIAEARLKRKKREKRNLTDVLTGICKGQLGEADVTQPHLFRLCQSLVHERIPSYERPNHRRALLRLFNHLHERRAKLFEGSNAFVELGDVAGNSFVEALSLIAVEHRAWIRPVEDWKPRSHSSRRQFSSLLRHLFVRYDDMPAFFDSVWFAYRNRISDEQRRWFLHVGRGENIRECDLPIPYTKKMAHHFMRAPSDCSIEQALRWGQVLGLGGDERLARALFGTRLTRSFINEDFWETVLRWFIAHPMLDRVHTGPIVDYLHQQKFVPEFVGILRGQQEELPPRQPNLSMKGRSPDALLRQVNTWHRRLAIDNSQQIGQWKPCGVESFEFFEGSERSGNLKCWTIRELLSRKALFAEGRKLKHCVATYASSCSSGDCSIWTMELESFGGLEKLITVEVRNASRTICQARGKANRLPTGKERSILRRWAMQADLMLANYV